MNVNDKKIPAFERLMIFSAFVSIGLLFYRCVFTLSFHYTYFLWNLLIAYVSYIMSKQLIKCKEINVKAMLLLCVWLLFFPACMYLFTDILQMHKTDNFSVFYDAFLYLSFAWNALLPGFNVIKKSRSIFKKTFICFPC